MFLNEPSKTQYDFSFNLFGFPVRVHPGFFILPLVFGANSIGGDSNPGTIILIFTVVFFISILIHELGHAVALRIFGVPSRIVLYWIGGLAIHETGWGGQRQLTHNQQILVSLAGPFAGFILAAILVGIVLAIGGETIFAWQGIFPTVGANLIETPVAGNESLHYFINIGLFCNIFWGILNLAPVIPLDGGQVCREICQKINYQNGIRMALMISVVAAGIIAFAGFANGDRFMGIFFAFMGYSCFMSLQQMSGRGRGQW